MAPLEASRQRTALTDSGWFWLLLFSLAGLAALGLIGPKYGKRQGRLEMQYQAHQEVDRRQYEGEETAREAGEEGSAPPPTVGELIIPLWPVAAALLMVALLSATGLWRATQNAESRGAP